MSDVDAIMAMKLPFKASIPNVRRHPGENPFLWCSENVVASNGEWEWAWTHHEGALLFFFKNERMAVEFKLRFG